MEYVGVPEEEVAAWEEWAGCAEAFGSGDGEWRLTVTDAEDQLQVTRSHMRPTTSNVQFLIDYFV
jgi:dimethylaniline monooxygenase (N-oxide forming)